MSAPVSFKLAQSNTEETSGHAQRNLSGYTAEVPQKQLFIEHNSL